MSPKRSKDTAEVAATPGLRQAMSGGRRRLQPPLGEPAASASRRRRARRLRRNALARSLPSLLDWEPPRKNNSNVSRSNWRSWTVPGSGAYNANSRPNERRSDNNCGTSTGDGRKLNPDPCPDQKGRTPSDDGDQPPCPAASSSCWHLASCEHCLAVLQQLGAAFLFQIRTTPRPGKPELLGINMEPLFNPAALTPTCLATPPGDPKTDPPPAEAEDLLHTPHMSPAPTPTSRLEEAESPPETRTASGTCCPATTRTASQEWEEMEAMLDDPTRG